MEAAADLLAERAAALEEPYSRHVGGKTRELRLALGRGEVRVSYWVAPGRRVMLLTYSQRPGSGSWPGSVELLPPPRPAGASC